MTDDETIRPLDRPVAPSPTLAVLRGTLAPDGAVLKVAAATPVLLQHEGPALVFDSYADMLARVRNAIGAGHADVSIPASNTRREIARIRSFFTTPHCPVPPWSRARM